ncbi:MAG: hypothetical protein GQ557_00275 [Mycoplasmataceae bacterium]|nr:hypothetical protein [Mycoplasmataceae bacterium]
MIKNKKKNFNKNTISLILIGFIFICAIIGSAFAISATVKNNSYVTADKYQSHYEIDVTVDGLSDDPSENEYNLEDIASLIDDRFEVAGVNQAQVFTKGEDELMIAFPLLGIDNETPFSWISQERLLEDIAIGYFSAFTNETIELRTVFGDSIFYLDSDGQSARAATNDELKPDDTTTTDPTDPTNLNYLSSTSIITDTTSPQIFSRADVKYNNGKSYFELTLGETPSISSSVNVFDQFNLVISEIYNYSLQKPVIGQVYMWSGYDTYSNLINKLDPEGYAQASAVASSSPISVTNPAVDDETEPTTSSASIDPLLIYAFTDPYTDEISTVQRTSSKPFLITSTTSHIDSLSRYNHNSDGTYFLNWYPDQALTSNEANNIANKINFATQQELSFDLVSAMFIYNDENEEMMKIVILVFSTIIILLTIFMIWYLGLLGIIAASLLVLMGALFIFIGSISGVSLSFLFVGVLFLFWFVTLLLIVFVGSIFKNNRDQSISIGKKYQKNMAYISNKILIPIMIFVIITVIFGLIAPIWISIVILVNVVYFVIMLFFILIVLPYCFYLIDLFFNYSKTIPTETFKSWNYLIGSFQTTHLDNDKIWNMIKPFKTKSSSLIFITSMIVFSVLTLGVFGIIFSANGSGLNLSGSSNSYYNYNVVSSLNGDSQEIYDQYINEFNTEEYVNSSPIDSDDPYMQQDNFDNLQDYEDDIEAIFDDAGVNVSNINLVRNDKFISNEIIMPDSSNNGFHLEFLYTYGYQIQSTSKMTASQQEEIQTALNEIQFKGYINSTDVEQDLNFALQTTTGSLYENQDYYVPYTVKSDSLSIFIALLIAVFALLIFMTIFYGWLDAFMTLSLLTFEVIFAFAMMMILWVPFGIGFWIALMTITFFSLITKSSISSKSTREIKILHERSSDLYFDIYDKKSKNIFNISLLFYGLSFILFALSISYIGIIAVSGMVALFLTIPLIIFLNSTIYPFLTSKLKYQKDNRKKLRHEKDEALVGKEGIISEEYIEGINK